MPGRYVSKTGEAMVNRGIYISEALIHRAQALAASEERTLADVLRRALTAGIDVLERRRATRSGDAP